MFLITNIYSEAIAAMTIATSAVKTATTIATYTVTIATTIATYAVIAVSVQCFPVNIHVMSSLLLLLPGKQILVQLLHMTKYLTTTVKTTAIITTI